MNAGNLAGISKLSRCSASLRAIAIPLLCACFSIPHAEVTVSAWLFWKNSRAEHRALITTLICGQKMRHDKDCECTQCSLPHGNKYHLYWTFIHDILTSSSNIIQLHFHGISLPLSFYDTAASWKQYPMISILGCSLTSWVQPLSLRAWAVEFHLNKWHHPGERTWTNSEIWTGFGLEIWFLKCCEGLTHAILHWCPGTAWCLRGYNAFLLSQTVGTPDAVPAPLMSTTFTEVARSSFSSSLVYLGIEVDEDEVAQLEHEDSTTLAELLGVLLLQMPSLANFHVRGAFPIESQPFFEVDEIYQLEEMVAPIVLLRTLVFARSLRKVVVTDWAAEVADVVSMLSSARGLVSIEAYVAQWDIDLFHSITFSSPSIQDIHFWFAEGTVDTEDDALLEMLSMLPNLQHLTLCRVGKDFSHYDDGPGRLFVTPSLHSVRFTLDAFYSKNESGQWCYMEQDLREIKQHCFDRSFL
ncbi:hypothetical protein GYMLUDRAFT_235899 [Collybiopsis luxurians FD-317 M1]|nr:hypothetical protein GYMLUDRAFT_235899 [Collybiopsis luxurians FD-317 M1]